MVSLFYFEVSPQSGPHCPGLLLGPLQLRRLELPQLCHRGDQGAEQEPAEGHLRLAADGDRHLPACQRGLLCGADANRDPSIQGGGCGESTQVNDEVQG